MRVKLTFLLVLLGGVIYAQTSLCLSDRYTDVPIFSSENVEATLDIPYATVQHYFTGQQQTLMLDVYAPSAEIDTIDLRPVVVLLHGGAWFSGNKMAMQYECREYARRGYVAVSVQYRLGWNCDLNNVFVACGCPPQNLQQAVYLAVQDARAALRFIAQNHTQWNIDPHWMFVGGESAGAITALLTSFWDQTEAETFVSPAFTSLVGGLNESGNSLSATYTIRGCINHCGGVPSVAHLQNEADIPIISFHDSQDCVVPTATGSVLSCLCGGSYFVIQGSHAVQNYLLASNDCSELHLVPQPLLPNHCSYPKLSLVQKASCFMKRRMCNFCMSMQTDDPSSIALCGVHVYTDSQNQLGCTYSNATNYNAQATMDDGSCIFDPYCPADLNSDGIVGVSDLILLLGAFGSPCSE